jgi:transmembrane sensor
MEERLEYLFQRYLANACTRKELEEFFSFIRQAEYDTALRQQIKSLYKDLEGSTLQSTFVDEKGRLVLTEPEWMKEGGEARKSRLGKPAILALASVMLLVVTVILIARKTGQSTSTTNRPVASLTRKTTDRSESKYLLLEDSTKVWLNAASSLEFPDNFEKDKREVFLTGEAFFDVKHADKIPFIIHTGKISTTVMGTAFNIKAYPGQQNVTVSVSRGKVKVSDEAGWATMLVKGEQVKVARTGNSNKERNVPVETIAAWQQGTLVYDDETLADITDDIQRVYNIEIKVNDPSIRELKISASFKKEIGVEQALHVLCKLLDRDLKQNEGTYIIQ